MNLSSPLPAEQAVSLYDAAIQLALQQLESNLPELRTRFPDHTSHGNRYAPRRDIGHIDGSNVGWTTGFWTGLFWLAYELNGNPLFRATAEAQLPSYGMRLSLREDIDHHDLGFLYTPSCVTAWRLTGNVNARTHALRAAKHLLTRFLPSAGIIQAWGNLDDPKQRGRIIIDCLLNLPLLHWASVETGNTDYHSAAYSHAEKSRDFLVRSDWSSYHTYFFDPTTGAPRFGKTAQGYSDDSCWARGQAWGIYGFALNHRYAPELGLLEVACKQAEYFIQRLPEHGIAYWDLIFGEESNEPWDSSASAIAVCGLLEIASQLPQSTQRQRYQAVAESILQSLIERCAGHPSKSNALLLHSVYAKPFGQGVDEASLWGDYFYLEALARVTRAMPGHW